mmetsp:Transcript_9248/g.11671  ORF Transcript_9248/g.11671 Transcript_9248/m.11671 type:complete len:238 (-) Transcript_9248:169-882(-)
MKTGNYIKQFVAFIMMMSLHTNAAFSSSPKINPKILCFGDSITAGTSPPLNDVFPYARHLENKIISFSGYESSLVRHFGLPGWSAKDLEGEGGLESILERIKSHTGSFPSLSIILAGTNDLAYCANESDCGTILESIVSIHKIANEKGIPSLALSIPPSGWQVQSSEAGRFATIINEKLENWANNEKLTTFVPFPISTFDRSTGDWAPDGLHFSPQGYAHIGERLATVVKEILSSDS